MLKLSPASRMSISLALMSATMLMAAQAIGLLPSQTFGSTLLVAAFTTSLTFLGGLAYLRREMYQMDAAAIPWHVKCALDTLSSGLVMLGPDQRILLANRTFAEYTGRTTDDLKDVAIGELDWVEDDEQPFSWATIADPDQTAENLFVVLDRGNDESVKLMLRTHVVLDEDDRCRGILVSFDDVTALQKKQSQLENMLKKLRHSEEESRRKREQLQILADEDPLTGCLNRRSFFTKYESHWESCRRYQHPLSVVMIDIDHFKQINDNHGHSFGDEVLRTVAKTLQASARHCDCVCRYGGEEFLVLMPHVNEEGAGQAAERYRGKVESLRFGEIRLTASFGVSSISNGATSCQELIEQADRCLYLAKRSGRNQVVSWSKAPPEVRDLAICLPEPSALETNFNIPFHAVAALISALHFRDPITADHCRRVADLCVATSNGYITTTDQHLLETAALLHDIGKLGVPESILHKGGPLSEEEWRIMRTHVLIGVEIIDTALNSSRLTNIIANLHAWFGGNPEQSQTVSGSDIPIEARILAIADAYDSMVSDRPYRKGIPQMDAFAELRRCTQQQFDPDLVEHFINVVLSRDECRRDPLDVVTERAAIHIGSHVEKLACAIDAQDVVTLRNMAVRLKNTAHDVGLSDQVFDIATRLEDAALIHPDWRYISALVDELAAATRTVQDLELNASL